MSVNKNCMFALALREGESTHISAIDNFQFWNNSFTLTMSFFQTGESDEVVLFNQEGIIKVGYRNSIFYVKVSDKEFLSEEGRMVVMPKVWNSISVAYDVSSKIVSAYINGIKDFEADLALEGELPVINSTGDYVLGEKFIGYFRKVFCYAGIHTEDEMFQIDNIDPVDATEHEFYLDFSAKEPKDIGKYGKNIFTTCFAFNKNIIPTIDFGECGYISSEGSEEVLSDDYTESAFTIVSKIYISDSRSSHILFAKENEACNGFFIGVFCTDGNPRLFFKNGETNVAIDRTLPLYTWLDLAFVCSNKRIQVFCDGEEFGECELPGELAFSSNKFTIGNAATQSSYKSFCGYIDYVAVFNGVKAKEELKKYISDIPYIYSKDISALYYLSDVNAVELINSKKIIINESVCCFAEDTQRVETDMLTYDNECENEISISSYDQWQGSLAAGLFLGSISSMGIRHRFGLDSNGMPTQSVAREFTKRVSSIPEHMDICLNSTSSTPAMTQSYLSALESAGILGSLGTLFGISSFEVDKFAIAILGAAAIGACSVLIATACEKGSDIILNNDNKEPPEQDPEDEKTVVYLKSITFAHNPQDKSSAVYLRRSENQSSSEWELGQTDATDALYIADRHENVSVKATIVFNKQFVGTILAKAEKSDDGILGDLEETKITVDSLTYPVEVEVSLKLARANFNDVKLGNYIDNLTWATRSEKGQIILDTSSHRTWILDTEPLEQWNILEKDEARNISIDTLKILDEIRKYDSSKEAGCKLSLTDTDSWLKQMVHFIHDSGKFHYNLDKSNNYSHEYYSEITFNIRLFENNFSQSVIEFSSMDSAMLLVIISALLGHQVGITHLFSNDENETNYSYEPKTKKLMISPDYVVFENVLIANGNSVMEFFYIRKYFVACINAEEGVFFYDPNIKKCIDISTDKYKYLYELPFTEKELENDSFCISHNTTSYREILVSLGNSCYYTKKSYSNILSCEAVVESPLIGGICYDTNNYIRDGYSNSPTHTFLMSIAVNEIENPNALSHRISYSFIEKVLVNATNMMLDILEPANKQDAVKALEALVDAIFPSCEYFYCDETKKNHDQRQRQECIQIIDQLNRCLTQETANDVHTIGLINTLLYLLAHSSYFNLKRGNSTWNNFILDNFDLDASWNFVYIVENMRYKTPYEIECIDGYCQLKDLSNEHDTKNEGLYLSPSDSYRYVQLLFICDKLHRALPIPITYVATNRQTFPFLPVSSELRLSAFDWSPTKRKRLTGYKVYSNNGEELFEVE